MAKRVRNFAVRDQLRSILQVTGWTRQQLADAGGVQISAVGKWLDGKNPQSPQLEARQAINRALADEAKASGRNEILRWRFQLDTDTPPSVAEAPEIRIEAASPLTEDQRKIIARRLVYDASGHPYSDEEWAALLALLLPNRK